VLRGGLGTGAISNERLNVTFQHHKTMKTLRESSDVVGCSVCRALADELEKREELDVTDNMEITIQAELSRLEDQESLVFETGSGDRILYRLDFTLEVQNVETLLRTFVLKPTSKSIAQLLLWTCMGCCRESVPSTTETELDLTFGRPYKYTPIDNAGIEQHI
jgi:hypothetical protein